MKEYTTPTLEVEEIETEDIMAVSSWGSKPGDTPITGWHF